MNSVAKIGVPVMMLIVLLLIPARQAEACSCDRPNFPCEGVGSAAAVFVGKMVGGGKEQYEVKYSDGSSRKYDVGELTFKVEEAFVGVKGSRVLIHSGAGNHSCRYWFVRGESYLIYANGDPSGNLWTSSCSRIRRLKDAGPDLTFLRNLPGKGIGGRIFGTVTASLNNTVSDEPYEPPPLAGITVKISGEKGSYEVVTDDKGNYEQTGLRAGAYKVQTVLPDHYVYEYKFREAKVYDRGCVNFDFSISNNSRIAGQAIQPGGRGLPKANVLLIPAESALKTTKREFNRTWADDDGNFVMWHVPPGRYLLGYNSNYSPGKEQPYPTTFHPGVSDPAQATVIEIGLGQRLTDINIQLPSKLTERMVGGFVVWPDGTPAGGVEIYLVDINYPDRCVDGCSTKTDAQGRFTLQGFEGYTYKVVASTNWPQKTYGEAQVVLVGDVSGIKVVSTVLSRPGDKEKPKQEEILP